MGMYTEFYFRANVKDGPAADWLDDQINGEKWFADQPQHTHLIHEWFNSPRWSHVFIGGGAVYQESRKPVFRRKTGGTGPYDNQLVLASSLKNYGSDVESFVDWITPHLKMSGGDFLGYSLYEDSCYDDEDGYYREHPTLYFMPELPKAVA
jgi:hypothetical protein